MSSSALLDACVLIPMRSWFPDAEVSGYEHLLPIMTNHPKDRHVLAAATHAKAKVITTANLKDFPVAALRPHGVDAVSPDDFLMDMLDRHLDQTVRVSGPSSPICATHPCHWTNFALVSR
jgi:hypothetical protein